MLRPLPWPARFVTSGTRWTLSNGGRSHSSDHWTMNDRRVREQLENWPQRSNEGERYGLYIATERERERERLGDKDILSISVHYCYLYS